MTWPEMTKKQQYLTCNVLFIFNQKQKNMRFLFQILQSLGNLNGGSAAMLQSHARHISKYMIGVFHGAL